jgi:phosphonopyruvate decarboxylase
MTLVDILVRAGVKFASGVPDSTLEVFIAELLESPYIDHQIAACEGSAVALAAGHAMATGHPCCVFMQNSGLPNALNPLLSMFSPAVYDIPLIMVIGWRGEPGTIDEPQHMVMGNHILKFLELLGISPLLVNAETAPASIEAYLATTTRAGRSATLLVSKGAMGARKQTISQSEISRGNFDKTVDRVTAIDAIMRNLPVNSVVFSSTGYTAREVMLYDSQMEKRSYVHIPCVGGMGFASSFAIGASSANPKRDVYCLDGDGAFLMQGLSNSVAPLRDMRFKHIVINNGCHNSVGGFSTCSHAADFVKIAGGMGYTWAYRIDDQSLLEKALKEVAARNTPAFLEIRCGLQSFGKLPRPDRPLADYKADYLNSVNLV